MKALLVVFLSLTYSPLALAEFTYRDSTRLNLGTPKLYDLGGDNKTALDKYKVIDLSANIEVGSSCGEMNISTNLRSNLNDLLDDQFFKGLGNRIQSAGGMLALCYLSPSYCAIAKHMRMSAHFLSQLNLDSCQAIDKYIDGRVADYDMEKQQCVRQAMRQNGQDVKAAVESCRGGADQLMDWSGASGKVKANAMIDATAKWAGLRGDDASRVVDVTKAFVGETVVAGGGVALEFGARKKMITPRELINEEMLSRSDKLNQVIDDIDPTTYAMPNQLKNRVLEVFDGIMSPEMAVETARKLSFMPTLKRKEAVRSLSKAIASQRVVKDAEKSMEILSLVARNPNLPPSRQQEAIALRAQLKDSLEMTMGMRRAENDQLAQVLGEIHKEGGAFEADASKRSIEVDAAKHNDERLKGLFFDCSDQVFCGGGT